jgi:hypothetical protein
MVRDLAKVESGLLKDLEGWRNLLLTAAAAGSGKRHRVRFGALKFISRASTFLPKFRANLQEYRRRPVQESRLCQQS